MDFIYLINSFAIILYGFVFGMSLMWWTDYYLNKDVKIVNKNKNIEYLFNEVKFLKIDLDMFKARLAVLDKEYTKKIKLT